MGENPVQFHRVSCLEGPCLGFSDLCLEFNALGWLSQNSSTTTVTFSIESDLAEGGHICLLQSPSLLLHRELDSGSVCTSLCLQLTERQGIQRATAWDLSPIPPRYQVVPSANPFCNKLASSSSVQRTDWLSSPGWGTTILFCPEPRKLCSLPKSFQDQYWKETFLVEKEVNWVMWLCSSDLIFFLGVSHCGTITLALGAFLP